MSKSGADRYLEFLENDLTGEAKQRVREAMILGAYTQYLKEGGIKSPDYLRKVIKATEQELGGDYPLSSNYHRVLNPIEDDIYKKVERRVLLELSKKFNAMANREG